MTILPPHRVRRRRTLHHPFPPSLVFPQLCPVAEIDWAIGWQPLVVWSESGLIEPGCVFTTREPEGGEAVWTTVRHDPEAFYVAFVKVIPGVTSTWISIALEPRDGGTATAAHVVYEPTSLGEAGDAVVERFTEETFDEFMRAWEAELNHFLATGRRLDEGETGES